MSEQTTFHVWITKYALTKGVFEKEAVETAYPSMICLAGRDGYMTCYHKPDWHTTREAADARVREMIAAKEKLLRKQLAKLQKLREQYDVENAQP